MNRSFFVLISLVIFSSACISNNYKGSVEELMPSLNELPTGWNMTSRTLYQDNDSATELLSARIEKDNTSIFIGVVKSTHADSVEKVLNDYRAGKIEQYSSGFVYSDFGYVTIATFLQPKNISINGAECFTYDITTEQKIILEYSSICAIKDIGFQIIVDIYPNPYGNLSISDKDKQLADAIRNKIIENVYTKTQN